MNFNISGGYFLYFSDIMPTHEKSSPFLSILSFSRHFFLGGGEGGLPYVSEENWNSKRI